MDNLFKHQIEGIEFLKKTKKAILADSMGLGKTRQAIIAAKEDGARTVLVICPASLKINWKREIEMVYPKDFVQIIDSDFEGVAPSIPEWMIINYDILEKKIDIITEEIERGWIDTIILDEAHYIKGKSIRARAIIGGKIKKKSGEVVSFDGIAEKADRVYALTGTPILNRPIELFNILKAVNHPLGRVRSAYSRRYCGAYLKTIIRRYGPPIRFLDESGATNLKELREKIKDVFLRRKKEEVLDLPPKITDIIIYELDYNWQREYDEAWDKYIQFLEENPMPEKNIDNIIMARQLVEIQKLKQVCSLSKINTIAEFVKNAIGDGEKILIFSQYTETIIRMKKVIELEGIKCLSLMGSDKMDKRQESIDEFQRGEADVFILNIKAGGVGLNLDQAGTVIFADMEWSPEIHNQAADRAHRIGQTKTVNIYYFIAKDTIEEDIMEILNSKKGVLDQVIDGKNDKVKTSNIYEEFLRRMANRATGDKIA